MGNINCDECGEQPYVALLTEGYEGYHDFDEVPDVEIWCECPTNRAIVFDGSSTFSSEEPEKWGSSGSRYVCYECGETPVMRSHTSSGRTHPRSKYHLSCACEYTYVGFNWRDIHPDKWKNSMDPTKWESHRDEIKQILEDEGPLTMEELQEAVDLDPGGVKCQVIHMQREHELHDSREDDGPRKFRTARMLYDNDNLVQDDEDDYSDSDETGLRSAKGSAFFSRLLRWWRNR